MTNEVPASDSYIRTIRNSFPLFFLLLIVSWLSVIAAYLLWLKFRDDRLHGRSFFDFGDFNFLIGSVTVLVVVFVALSLFSPGPHFDTPDKQIAYGEKTHQPQLVSAALWKKLAKNPLDRDLNYQLIKNHFSPEENDGAVQDSGFYEAENTRIFSYYSDMAINGQEENERDIGSLFLSFWYMEHEGSDMENATFFLRQVKNKNAPYVHLAAGRILFYEGLGNLAEDDFRREIETGGCTACAYEELALIYDENNREAELTQLIRDPQSRDAVPEELRSKVYFLQGNLWSFFRLHFTAVFEKLQPWGLAGNVLILFVWIFFLQRLSFLSAIKWRSFFLVTGIGALLAASSWLLYAFYHYVLHFDMNGKIANDFLYCFLGIGCIEELVKLLPFLLILYFTKIIRRPIDYLLIASAAGLGFAFLENLLYISRYGLDVIHSRALTASVSHMVSSSIVAYGFVLVKFRSPKKWWLIPAFFFIAAFAHGFYDFWLTNQTAHIFSIITLFFFLSEILVYVSFLNNALNQSVEKDLPPSAYSINTLRLAGFIAGALVLVFTLEYAGTCFVYGKTAGNHALVNSFFSGGYLVFFLSMRLSNIDIIPGEWAPIEFFSGLLPSGFAARFSKPDYNSLIGKKIIFEPGIFSRSAFSNGFSATIRARHHVGNFSGWFEAETDDPGTADNFPHRTVFIRARNPGELISEKEAVIVGVFVRTTAGSDVIEPGELLFVDWMLAKKATEEKSDNRDY